MTSGLTVTFSTHSEFHSEINDSTNATRGVVGIIVLAITRSIAVQTRTGALSSIRDVNKLVKSERGVALRAAYRPPAHTECFKLGAKTHFILIIAKYI